MDSSRADPRWQPSPRAMFSRQFAALFEAAGNPTLRRVAAAADARMRGARAAGQKSGVPVQRISDWKAGRNVPARFESLLPVLLTLIDEARKSSRPVPPALLDVQEWKRLWTASNEWDPESETFECPYLGLTSYRRRDAELFFGRTRPSAEFAELVRTTVGSGGEGGIVMLLGASGAGKSSLLEAGLLPALADPVGEWAIATLTPGAAPVRALLDAVGSEGSDRVVDGPSVVESGSVVPRVPVEPDADRVATGTAAVGCASGMGVSGDSRVMGLDERRVASDAAVVGSGSGANVQGESDGEGLDERPVASQDVAVMGSRSGGGVVAGDSGAARSDEHGVVAEVVVVGSGVDVAAVSGDPDSVRLTERPVVSDVVADAVGTASTASGIRHPVQGAADPNSENAGGSSESVESLAAALAAWGPDRRRLIIVDQFEELFTLCHDEHQRETFLAALEHIAIRGEREPAAVVIAVRADFYARCVDVPVLEDALKHRSYLLGPMRLDELAEAISRPAELAGYKLESGLEELIISELCGLGGRGQRHGYDPGALPLMSHVMAAVWQRRDGMRLTIEGYRQAGGVVGSVAATAEKAWGELSEFQRAIGKQVLLELVAVGDDSRDTRRKVARADLVRQTVEAAEAALEVLARTRLITLDAEFTYLTHEIVLDAWPRLRGWIDEDRVGYLERQRLQVDASEWVTNGRDPSMLYRGARLTTMQEHAQHGTVGAVAGEFLSAARAARRRAERRSSLTKAALALLGVVALVLAGVAFVQSGTAKQQRDNAIFAAVLAESDRLESIDPSLSAQLALVADRIRPGDPEVDVRLANTQNMALASLLKGHQGFVYDVDLRPDGRLAASAGADNTVRLWDLSDRQNPAALGAPLTGHSDFVADVEFSPDGTLLASAGAEDTVRLWDVRDPAHARPIGAPLPIGYPTMVAFGSDGTTLATSGADDGITFWDIADPSRPTVIGTPVALPRGDDFVFGAALSRDLRTVVVISDKGTTLWRVTDPRVAAVPIGRLSDDAVSAVFAADGTTVAVAAQDAIHLWDIRDPAGPRLVGKPLDYGDKVHGAALAFSADGRILAAESDRGTVALWNIADPENPVSHGKLAGSAGAISGIDFTSDRHTALTGGQDGTVRVWSLPATGILDPARWRAAATIDATGEVMATVTDSAIEVWQVGDGRAIRRLGRIPFAPAMATHPAMSPDGRMLLLDGDDQRIRIFDISDPTAIRESAQLPRDRAGLLSAAAFSPDSKYLVTGGIRPATGAETRQGDVVQLWDVVDPAHPRPLGPALSKSSDMVSGVAFSPDGTLLAIGRLDESVMLWDISDPAAPKRRGQVPFPPTGSWTGVAWSPRNDIFVTTSDDQNIRVWNTANPDQPVQVGDPLTGHTSFIASMSFSADGRLLATAGRDGVRLWNFSDRDAPTPIRHPVAAYPGAKYPLAATFRPDGKYLFGIGAGGEGQLWNLDPKPAVDRICAFTRTVLTPQAWRDHLPELAYAPPCA
ncbi:hypothetical protein [Nocardia sp. NPDC050710]|uniref:nSTAND1 domain-containing NTPase n=1 Tax=Nocardia sp. NPDC050710 TaxID=3157220 RepID=UPI0033F79597